MLNSYFENGRIYGSKKGSRPRSSRTFCEFFRTYLEVLFTSPGAKMMYEVLLNNNFFI